MPHEQVGAMSVVTFVFPHQLFEKHPALSPDRPVYLIEEYLSSANTTSTQTKLAFHRASMKAYQEFLEHQGFMIAYL